MVYYYDAHRASCSCLFVFTGTTSQCAVKSFEFWYYLIQHAVLNFLITYDHLAIPRNWHVEWDAVGLAVGVQTFIMVFFLSKCYARYLQLYFECMGMDEA